VALTRFAIRIPVRVTGWMGAIIGHLIRGGSSILHEGGPPNARTIMPNAGNQNSDGERVYSSREWQPTNTTPGFETVRLIIINTLRF